MQLKWIINTIRDCRRNSLRWTKQDTLMRLSQNIDNVTEWTKNDKLVLGKNKCTYLNITKIAVDIDIADIRINDIASKGSKNVKYLELTIEQTTEL